MEQKRSSSSQSAVEQMSREATPSNQRLGKELFEGGTVRVLEASSDRTVVEVAGGQTRKVEFLFSSGDLTWRCTCRREQHRFCKHAVAAALVLLGNERHG